MTIFRSIRTAVTHTPSTRATQPPPPPPAPQVRAADQFHPSPPSSQRAVSLTGQPPSGPVDGAPAFRAGAFFSLASSSTNAGFLQRFFHLGTGATPSAPSAQEHGRWNEGDVMSAIRRAAAGSPISPEEAVTRYDHYQEQQEALLIDRGMAPDEASQQAIWNAAILTRRDILSQRAMNGETMFTRNEYLIMYEAASIETGVPAEVLKAVAHGETFESLYETAHSMPRQFWSFSELLMGNRPAGACSRYTGFYDEGGDAAHVQVYINPSDGTLAISLPSDEDRRDNEGRVGESNWYKDNGYVPFPVVVEGDQGATSMGFGIHALTLGREQAQNALASGQETELAGGNDVHHWQPLLIDVDQALRDPSYNILMAAKNLVHAIPGATDGEYKGSDEHPGLETRYPNDFPPDGTPEAPLNVTDWYASHGLDFVPDGLWASIAATSQGTVPDPVTAERVTSALQGTSADSDWDTAEPDIYDASTVTPEQRAAEQAARDECLQSRDFPVGNGE